jgi:protein O-mannosyl-transferase
MKNNIFSSRGICLILIILLGLTAFLYYPALYSHFVFDDFYNLAGLSEINKNGYFYYVFGGFAGPSGRPVSLLSFALQYQNWPANPFSFKLVNLIIHLLNGILIWAISRFLIRHVEKEKKYQEIFALITAGIWLIHPIQITTVLYVVQRMTQLSCLFTLMGIYGYLYYREKLQYTDSLTSYCFLSILIGTSTFLAVMSKENGILLLLFILVIESTFLSNSIKTEKMKLWSLTFLVAPLLLLIMYFVFNIDSTLSGYQFRPFSVAQRLMTEPSVLLIYIKNLIFPLYGAFTLYHDDFPISTSLFSPPYTIVSILVVIGALFFALKFREVKPVISFSILWFLCGHILESSYLNLELYFEHRNYLPSFGVIFGVSYLIIKFVKTSSSNLISVSCVLVYCFLIITSSYIDLKMWSKPGLQALEWARLHPESERSLTNLADTYLNTGGYDEALSVYTQIGSFSPDSLYPAIQKLHIKSCFKRTDNLNQEWEETIEEAKYAKSYGLRILGSIDQYMAYIIKNECHENDLRYMEELLNNMLENQGFIFIRGQLFEIAATIQLRLYQYERSLYYISEALNRSTKPSNYLYKIKLLRTMGRNDEADALIEKFKESVSKNPRTYLAYYKMLNNIN